MKRITASCIISNHTVFKNGIAIFENSMSLSEFLLSVYKYTGLNYPRFYKMDNLSKLGWLTTEILLAENFNAAGNRPEEVGLVLSNANASLDTDLKYYESVHDIPSPSLFVYTLPNIMTGEICIRNNFKGENAFFIAERFDASFIEQYVNDLMDNDILNVCICGWVDLLGEEYKAALFLVEKGGGVGALSDRRGSDRTMADTVPETVVNTVADETVGVGAYPISFTAGALDKIFQGENQ
jgi:hypothetical protein